MRILSLVFCFALSCFLMILLLVFLPLYGAIALSLQYNLSFFKSQLLRPYAMNISPLYHHFVPVTP